MLGAEVLGAQEPGVRALAWEAGLEESGPAHVIERGERKAAPASVAQEEGGEEEWQAAPVLLAQQEKGASPALGDGEEAGKP